MAHTIIPRCVIMFRQVHNGVIIFMKLHLNLFKTLQIPKWITITIIRILIRNHSWVLTIHKVRILRKNTLTCTLFGLQKADLKYTTTDYNGASMVLILLMHWTLQNMSFWMQLQKGFGPIVYVLLLHHSFCLTPFAVCTKQ